MVQAGMKISFEAESVNKNTPSDMEFEMKVPEGFNIVGMEELQNLGGLGTFGL
jgi:outer membrane lipoprotein-sorting protein